MPTIPIATSTGEASGIPLAGGYGSKTESAGTAITRVVPARPQEWGFVTGFSYKPAATAHTLTIMGAQDVAYVNTDAASGQATVTLKVLPVAFDGAALANTDWFVVEDEDGFQLAYLLSSVSGNVLTFTANLSSKLLANSRVWLMGTPADHANWQITTVASTEHTFTGNYHSRFAGYSKDSPLLLHSDNATNAGVLRWLNYCYSYGGTMN